ncbi:MAG: fasciclin domain-containing protein [Prolixibacteraceae bacterium]|nr:fasciclin domain-containing protein [Prolixibacteraceae bacterium]
MKSIKQIIFATVLTVSVSVVNASELNKVSISNFDISETDLKIESWMTGIDMADVKNSGTSESTVVEIAVSNPDFSILVEAVSKAGLVEALSAEGPFTVFAPTNSAFESLFTQLGVKGVGDLTVDQLMPILTYHVVSGKVMSTDLSNGEVGTLNKDSKLKVDLSSGVKINESNVVAADIQGKNGVIHVIDKVLLPQ